MASLCDFIGAYLATRNALANKRVDMNVHPTILVGAMTTSRILWDCTEPEFEFRDPVIAFLRIIYNNAFPAVARESAPRKSRMSSTEIYYSSERRELVAQVDLDAPSVLEIGCGYGNTLAAIKRDRRAKEVWGVEVVREVAQKAMDNPALDRVLCGDIAVVVDELPEGGFSHIIAGDVLEHLVDPWTSLERLHSCLKPGGKFICSIPNIRTLSFLAKLLFTRRFEYKDSGVLDRTHLRFFARRDIELMFQGAGFIDIEITALVPGRNAIKRFGRFLFGDLVLKRFLITARKNPQGETLSVRTSETIG